MDILSRIIEIKVKPYAADDLDELKKSVSEYAKTLGYADAKIYFYHDGNTYVCDAEGNVARLGKTDLFDDLFED